MNIGSFVKLICVPWVVICMGLVSCDSGRSVEPVETAPLLDPDPASLLLTPDERTGKLNPCTLSKKSGKYYGMDFHVGVSCPYLDAEIRWLTSDLAVLDQDSLGQDIIPGNFAEKTRPTRQHSVRYEDSIYIQPSTDSTMLMVRAWLGNDSSPVTAAVYYHSQRYATGVMGLLIDSRDGSRYNTVQILDQVWMAQNLSFRLSGTDSGWCYGNSVDSCSKYGRLYSWTQVLGGAFGSGVPLQGICPSGWHVPMEYEWERLERNAVALSGYGAVGWSPGLVLKSCFEWRVATRNCRLFSRPSHGLQEWMVCDSVYGNGYDLWGFRALPGGFRDNLGVFDSSGTVGSWWGANASGDTAQWGRELASESGGLLRIRVDERPDWARSLRCVKD